MARRRLARGRRPRQRVVWDEMSLVQADLPNLLLDSAQAIDGAFSSVLRWRGSDVTLLRTIFSAVGDIELEDHPVNPQAVLELCVGLSFFDSMADIQGLAINTTIGAGTGPLDDVDNSRWHARCCLLIPIGIAAQLAGEATGHTVMMPFGETKNSPGFGWCMAVSAPAGSQKWQFYCEWDSKAKRRIQGAEGEWLQLALQARVSTAPAVGDDIIISLNAFSGRMVRTMGATVET